jgi:ribosomal protein L11 methyltransferase
MAWLAITLTVEAAVVETLTDALLAAGALAIDVTDAHAGTPLESALFNEPGDPAGPAWTLASLRALFDEGADIGAHVAVALTVAGLDPHKSCDVERVEDQDWVRATQNQFQPVRITQRLWVVPTWHTPPDPAATNLIIDPGLAFGTGTHPTTRLCLQWLSDHLRNGETVLDYGCGSGILAIAAAKLGAARACGVDIDPVALLAAQDNAMQNQVTVEFSAATAAAPEPADIVLANILANPLKLLAPLLAQATRASGRIVLAGFLEHQCDEISAVYRAWFDLDPPQHEAGWVLLSGTKRGALT